MKKRVLSLCLAGLMAASLTGCGGAGNAAETTAAAGAENSAAASEAGSSEAKEELVFVNYRDIRDLNPHLYAGEMYAQEMLYETLVNITADGYEGCLAESWDISDDGKTYTFHIRDGVKFSDGEVCDANAIKANFDAIIENKDRHTWLEMMNLLVGVSAPDDKTFVIELSEPYYPLLTELGVTRPFAMISPKAMKDGSTKDGVNAYIGTGPYVLTDFVTDEYAVFEANENYWGEQPKIKKITVKVIPDNQTRILALEKGEIDMIFGKNMIDADAINQYTGNDKFTVSLSDPTSTRQIVLNTTRDVLADKEVRQALQHATNKQAISDGIFYGLEQPADTLFAKTVPYCDIDLEPYAYDVELAQSMLDEAGWVVGADKIRERDGQKLNIDLLYNSDSVTEKAIAEYLQSEYQKIGISLNIHGEEEQSYRDNMKAGNFDMVFNICWGTPYDPQSSLAAMRAPVYGDYAAQLGLEDKADIDQAITDILVSTDETKRQGLYTFVLTRLHEDAVYIPLTYECNKAIYRSDLQGFHFTQTQYEVPFADFYFE
ncbi:nickel ABC transporter, nickel/metallophore periplasmic binding protein [Clostridiaceae bacterium AF02-42]|uniref:nickel ABC transporter substrate-binding protein n=1 Tax=Clostridium sp. AF28-12 TaxID=2305241 RepID=UPI000E3F299A|nr:nickel ABC transporter substrate-binding protein [Clostridium sp. AF28-12]RGE00160.1 nickel ABC transporter, nickel/metallophore periplasmic binding protein [Clostridiaceae bacterium AF02-42]RGE01124.1 nickel ABC transporter, nickel/metallophore periplasmic binding protein [Clostridium sp. AF28-12]